MVANEPNDLIYDFKGYFEFTEDNGETLRESLSLENTMWANTVLASTGHCLAMVIYTGIETRTAMNSKEAQSKVGKLDLEINKMSKFLFVFMLIIAFAIVALD